MKTSTVLLAAGAGAIGIGAYLMWHKKANASPTGAGKTALPAPTADYLAPEVKAAMVSADDKKVLADGYSSLTAAQDPQSSPTMTSIPLVITSATPAAGQSALDFFKLLLKQGYSIVVPDYLPLGYQQGGSLSGQAVRALKGQDLLSAVKATQNKFVVLLTPADA